MKDRAFITGLKAIFAADANLAPSAVSRRAELDTSTVRKILDGSSRNPGIATVEKIARALGTTVAAIEALGGDTPTKGFAEERTAFAHGEATPLGPDENTELAEVITSLLKTAQHGATYKLRRGSAGFGLRAGDILVLDIGRLAKPGEMILVGVTDRLGHETRTMVRRYVPPFALSADPDEPTPALAMGNDGLVAWRGTVIAMLRGQMTGAME